MLDHLARIRAVGDLNDDEGVNGLEVRSIEPLALNHSMQINADALFSLQVFEDESHASIHSDKTKEGLSLFGILNHTKTTLGRALMREWLLRPSLSLTTISDRHDAVACFMQPDNQSTASTMHSHLNGIKNIPRILGLLRAGKARVSDWQCLVKVGQRRVLLLCMYSWAPVCIPLTLTTRRHERTMSRQARYNSKKGSHDFRLHC